MGKFRPLLAAAATLDQIESILDEHGKLLISAKLDGIRALVIDGEVLSRSLKPIPNKFVQDQLGKIAYNGLDGELIVGSATDKDVYRKTMSGIMSRDGAVNFTFRVFDDYASPSVPFEDRYRAVSRFVKARRERNSDCRLVAHKQTVVNTIRQIERIEEEMLALGFEGLIIRSPGGTYKHGRSTLREGIMLKLKRFEDSEAEIIGWAEEFENTNEATEDNLGLTERSTHKAGKVGKGMLGAFKVRDIKTGQEFQIGSGFDRKQRAVFWKQRRALKGAIVKYKHFSVGVKELPRFPIFLGMRHPDDIGEKD